LIDIYVKLGDAPSAMGVWQHTQAKVNQLEVLTRLKRWDAVQPTYREQFQQRGNFEAFHGLLESLGTQKVPGTPKKPWTGIARPLG
jgi:hypothetical protein